MRLSASSTESEKWEVRKVRRGLGELKIEFLKSETAVEAAAAEGKDEPMVTRTPNISA